MRFPKNKNRIAAFLNTAWSQATSLNMLPSVNLTDTAMDTTYDPWFEDATAKHQLQPVGVKSQPEYQADKDRT
jgi:hypothetical protein